MQVQMYISFIWICNIQTQCTHVRTYVRHTQHNVFYSNYDYTREVHLYMFAQGVSAVHSTSTYPYNCCPLFQLHDCVTCSTLDNICLPDLVNCMGIFVVCQLQLNSITLFLTHTVCGMSIYEQE